MKYTELLTSVNLFLRLQITFQNSYWQASASPSSEAPPAPSPPVLGALRGADSLPAVALHLISYQEIINVESQDHESWLWFSKVFYSYETWPETLLTLPPQCANEENAEEPKATFYKITEWSKPLYWLKKAPGLYYNWDYS